MFGNKTDLVFIGMFNFLGFKPISMQALFQSCQLSPNFFGEVMHFCKFFWIDFMKTYLKPLHTFSSLVTYCQNLEKPCPKHVP